MAEVVCFSVAERLHDLLMREAAFLHGVRDEIEWLQTELRRMQCLLKVADQGQDTDQRVRNWVSEIRNVAYDAEDIVDTFLLKEALEGRGVLAFANKCACIFRRGSHLYATGKKIENLKKKIHDISCSLENYGVRTICLLREESNKQSLWRLRRTSSCPNKEQVVGFEDSLKILMEQLFKEDQQRCVISILGMGGLGKTTLARKLFNSLDVKGLFDCYAWVCVSQEYTTRDLLQRSIKSFQKPTKESLEWMERMTEEDLEYHLYEFLSGKRYLAVIDDVWDREAWESLRRAFPDDGNGSRVIITSRNKAVVRIADEKTFVHNLRFLTQEESWKLFCDKAFPDATACGMSSPSSRSFCCPPGLEKLGRKMVGKCGGLPLAIIVLGSLLSRKQPHEWHAVKYQMWRHLTNDSDHVSSILALSYHELPFQLKPCFLYLSLFPEDFMINTEKLIRLWIAEGFIPKEEGVTEDVAEEYLKELIDRSLIQVAERNFGRIASCRIHDLLRDLAVKNSKEVNFLDIYDGDATSAPCTKLCRRQAIHSGNTKYVSLDHSTPHLRSLLFFNPDLESLRIEQLEFVYSRLRLLRVLDLAETRIQSSSCTEKVVKLPSLIGKLIHLRYFGFKSSEIVEFPSSIGNLRSLQTLVAGANSKWIFPVEICKLNQLRHLIGNIHGFLPSSVLINLQTLKHINFQQWIKINAEDLFNLRELEIREVHNLGKNTLNSIACLTILQSLTLETKENFPQLLPLSSCQHLLKLKLDGKIEDLPDVHEFPPNLTILILLQSKLKHDPMPILERLPNLFALDIGNDSYLRNEMFFSENGFSQLQVLRLSWLRSLESLHVETGAMPGLKSCSIEDCSKLLTVPERLRLLPLPQEW